MQPTHRPGLWSAWAGWAPVPRDELERRIRLSVHELVNLREMANLRRLDWKRLPPHEVTLFTPKQLEQFIRMETNLARFPPTPGPDGWLADHKPDTDARYRMQEFLQNVRAHDRELSRPRLTWEGAARAWAAGAVLLAVVVLFVRAIERCLKRRIFKDHRRSSEEWPSPNVLATSHHLGLDDSDSFPSESREPPRIDLPPPYSECANNEEATASVDANKPIGMEEPPPPYSACYFSNPKDGIPTVHFYSRREIGHSGTDTQAPIPNNVSSNDDDKIDGCEAPVAENLNQTDANNMTVREDNAVVEPNPDIRQEVSNTQRNEHTDHVVQIDGVEVISQERAEAV